MSERKIKRALISVYDKTGIVDFARALVDEFKIEIISTGGTAKLLKESGIAVTMVEEVTGFPEMMDGRVKTLHPKIHAGILADRDNPEHMRQLAEQGIEPIDMVVVNLYPFEETIKKPDCTFEQAIEMIDIGGPCMLRAAAKNHKHVLVVYCSSAIYPGILKTVRRRTGCDPSASALAEILAVRAFVETSAYDASVSGWLEESALGGTYGISFVKLMSRSGSLRYGENPKQSARLHGIYKSVLEEQTIPEEATIESLEPDEDVPMSFNNYADGHAALELCKELTRELSECGTQAPATQETAASACVFIKHTNACGASVRHDPIEAYRQAYLGDPNAAMGGILACNFDIKVGFAQTVMETYSRFGKEAGAGGFFAEVWIAPSFDDSAVQIIRSAKKWGERVRLLSVGDMSEPPDEKELEYRSITGGMLVQTRDLVGLNEDQWKVVTKRVPTDAEMADLRLAWLVCKHTKSNAISLCIDGMLIGNGAGQMSRVMSCRIATWLAKENGHEASLPGSVAASDAFFPFPDGPNILMDAGVTAIIQPGGSKRDAETIAACDERGVAMVVTGTRHFKH